MRVFILFSTCYILGSVNFSILLFKLLGKDDPRTAFSGNAGVVNIYRQAGVFRAGIVLLLDLSRAMGVAWLVTSTLPVHLWSWGGLFLILGNRFPCFHGFKGGKGVANYLGFTFVLSPVSAALSILAWLISYGISRVPFFGSFAMISVLGFGTIFAFGFNMTQSAGLILTLAVIGTAHFRNIREFRENISGIK